MKKLDLAAATIGLMTIFATPAQAQMSAAFTQDSDLQARATFTIPFGGDSQKSTSKPQLSLGFRSETVRPGVSDWALRPTYESVDIREFKLSLTVEDTPTLLLNDQALMFGDQFSAKDGKKSGLDTYDKTVLTVIAGSLAVIVGVIAVTAD